MDRRKTYLCGADTETCNGIGSDLTQSLVYDFGYVITDKKANIEIERSFLVKEIFCDEAEMMKSSYYAKKLPQYWEDVKAGKRQIKPLMEIRKIFLKDLKDYNCKIVFAHNAGFDLRALNNTVRWVTKSKVRFFFPYGCQLWDTLKMAKDTIGKQKSYISWCERNGYMTKHKKPRVRLTAEILYRYISGQNDFIESHTGLEDVLIESKILAHCFRQHKPMRKTLFA